ncbi:MAG: hypothetical protein M3N50_06355 [Pseudomonadota bacterium]|nr:hypothetical protein [Pseudomonadota bacterium]
MSTHYFRFAARRLEDSPRCAPLERLLARSAGSTAVLDWRTDAFRVIAPQAQVMPGLGAVALHAAGGVLPGAWVWFATPVHYVAETNNVRMAADGILSLTADEAKTLASDFNRVWRGAGIRLRAIDSGRLFVVLDESLPGTSKDPEEVLDRPIGDYLPTGTGAAGLRRLMSEIEMWLFDHEVNRRRIAAGVAPVSGLWLWGGGPMPAALPAVRGWSVGNDPFFAALCGASSELSGTSSGVIVTADAPGTHAWQEIGGRWLPPAVEQLRSGRLSRIILSAGERSFAVTARRSWRIWRRPRPWWEYFA